MALSFLVGVVGVAASDPAFEENFSVSSLMLLLLPGDGTDDAVLLFLAEKARSLGLSS